MAALGRALGVRVATAGALPTHAPLLIRRPLIAIGDEFFRGVESHEAAMLMWANLTLCAIGGVSGVAPCARPASPHVPPLGAVLGCRASYSP